MKQHQHNHTKRGFTLIELSIAAVIIALLAIAVTTGKGLLEHARIRSLSQEMLDLNQAFTFFQEQYGELPGDMTDASAYWGAINGNGDERIISIPTSFPPRPEEYSAWRHLQLAGMLGGNELTGLAGGVVGRRDDVVGVHVPASDTLTSAGYWVQTFDTLNGVAFDGTYLTVGTPGVKLGPVLTPRQASVLDHKLDDGTPRRGRMRDRYVGDTDFSCSTVFLALSTDPYIYFSDIDDETSCVLSFRIDTVL